MLGGDYEWQKCFWIRSNFPEENLAEKSSCPVTEHAKKVNVQCKKVDNIYELPGASPTEP